MTREEAFNIYEVVGSEIIDSIYDDFESRVCENCKHLITKYGSAKCMSDKSFAYSINEKHICDFGCNKFERKIDGN